jgi:hypothetical protein
VFETRRGFQNISRYILTVGFFFQTRIIICFAYAFQFSRIDISPVEFVRPSTIANAAFPANRTNTFLFPNETYETYPTVNTFSSRLTDGLRCVRVHWSARGFEHSTQRFYVCGYTHQYIIFECADICSISVDGCVTGHNPQFLWCTFSVLMIPNTVR